MNAQALVNKLLETSPYDADDPLEKPEIATGFIARQGTDRVEWRYDTKARGYRMSKYWVDEYTGKERVLANGILHHAADKSAWVESEMQRWREAGWEIEEL